MEMRPPKGLVPLVDGDILRYELGYAVETGWAAITGDPEAKPPFDYVERLLLTRLENIKGVLETSEQPHIYLTEGRTFRYDIAKRKPYKGQRPDKKPFHFGNLTAYLVGVLDAKVITGIEADDALAIDHLASGNTTVLCSRDKDLKQIPGWFYSWELGLQPSFGPCNITKEGHLHLSDDHKKLSGTGLSFFYGQVLVGDTADNIPGLPKCGPVAAFEALSGIPPAEQLEAVQNLYERKYGIDAEAELLEQGRLLWLTRRLDENQQPVLYEIGMEE